MNKKAADNHRAANDDTVIYKVMIALGILCIAILGLQLIRRFYGTADGMPIIHTLMGWTAPVLGVAALAALILGIAGKTQLPRFHKVSVPLFVVLSIFACSALALWRYWVEPIPYLYFIFIAATILYMIFLLYQMEFFLLSFLNVCAGLVFYLLSHRYPEGVRSPHALLLTVFLAVMLLLVAALAFFAAKHDGKLRAKERTVRLFHTRFSPIPLYLTALIWLVCLIASALLGSVCAYYCVFAAAAWELIFAVYYTFKLT